MNQFRVLGLLIVLAVAALSWAITCGTWQFTRVAEGVAPIDPRQFPRLTAVTLGTGGARENPDRRGPATAVGLGTHLILVDAGRSVAEALRASRIPPSQPEAVLLTNLLPENTVGLDDLALTGWLDGRAQPLRLLGPPGTRSLAAGLSAAHGAAVEARAADLDLPPLGAGFAVEEIGDGWSARLGDIRVRAAALPGGPLPALAYRFEWEGRSAVVSGTGWAPDALVELARGAGLLIHEAVYVPEPELAAKIGLDSDPRRLRREAALHTEIEEVGKLAQRAGVETLALVRLRPPPVYDIQLTRVIDDTFSGRIVIAADGDELTP